MSMVFRDLLILLSPTLVAALWLMLRRDKDNATKADVPTPRKEPPPLTIFVEGKEMGNGSPRH